MECLRLALSAIRIGLRRQPLRPLSGSLRQYASKADRTRKRTLWSEAEDDTVIRLKKAGKTLEEISEALPGRTPTAVAGRLYLRLKAKAGDLIASKSLFSEEEIARVMELWNEGLSWDAIALHFPKRSINALRMALHRKQNYDHIDGNRSLYTSAETTTLLHCRRDLRLSWPEIYPKLPDRTPESIRGVYRNLVPRAARARIDSVHYLTRQELAELVRLRDSGMSWPEVHQQLNGWNIRNLQVRYLDEKIVGIKEALERGRHWKKEDDQILVSLSQGGHGWQNLAMKELGKTRGAVDGRWKYLKSQRALGLLAASAEKSPDNAG